MIMLTSDLCHTVYGFLLDKAAQDAYLSHVALTCGPHSMLSM